MSEIKLKPTTTELAESIKKEITIDPKSGVGTITAGHYAATLPEGVTAELIEKIQDHNTQLVAAAGLAFGQLSEDVLKKNKELPRTTLELPTIGQDRFNYTYDRTSQVPDRTADGVVGTKSVHGTLTVGYKTFGTKSRGELLKVKKMLAEDAAKAFGG
jgi:hypothetical protein